MDTQDIDNVLEQYGITKDSLEGDWTFSRAAPSLSRSGVSVDTDTSPPDEVIKTVCPVDVMSLQILPTDV